MSDIAYSLHIGSDKNKRATARRTAKNTRSGTTSLSNNAIQNAQQYQKQINIIIENMTMNKI